MTRPDFTGIRPDVAEYITSLEQDTAQKQQELGQRDERIAQLETRVADIMQMLQNLQRLYFGKKSEKIRIPAVEDGAEQLSIFSQEEPAPILQPNLTDDFLESLMPWNEAVRAECQRGYI